MQPGSTADCPLDTFCNSGVGDCVALLEGWCRTDQQCAADVPLCSNRAQGSAVPGSCVACVDDDDCAGDDACVSPGVCVGASSCPLHATPVFGGECLCDPGYVDDGAGTCRPDGQDPTPDGCASLDVSCRDFGYAAGNVVRSADCRRLDIAGCFDVCGDGDVGPSEHCDGELNPFVCEDFGLVSGVLDCNPTTCLGSADGCIVPVCGNGVREADEPCDGDDNGALTCAGAGFTEGTLRCFDGCSLDMTACTYGDEREVNDTPAVANPWLASFSGQVNPQSDVDCLQLDAGAGDIVVVDVVGVDSGELGDCAGDPALTLLLGDAVVASNDNSVNGRCPHVERVVDVAGRYSVCVRSAGGTFPYVLRAAARPVVCGDGVVEGNETCDGAELGDRSCTSLGGISGTLGCQADCAALDDDGCVFFGTEREPNDVVAVANPFDPAFLGTIDPAGEADCMAINAAAGDIIRADLVDVDSGVIGGCNSDPTLQLFDSAGAQLAYDDDTNGLCSHISFTVSVAGTYALCVEGFSSSSTFTYRLAATVGAPRCGDGLINNSEVCEANDLNGASCFGVGAVSGTLGCSADCSALDTSACVFPVCGDGVTQRDEVCDGDLPAGSCVDRGFSGGTVGCSADCAAIDTTPCVLIVDEVESNDTPTTANPFDASFLGQITSGDQDCMQIEAAAGQRIVGDLVGLESGAVGDCGSDPTLTLFGSDGAQLAFNDDTAGFCSHVEVTASSSGTFTLCVRGFRSNETFLYRLDATAR